MYKIILLAITFFLSVPISMKKNKLLTWSGQVRVFNMHIQSKVL